MSLQSLHTRLWRRFCKFIFPMCVIIYYLASIQSNFKPTRKEDLFHGSNETIFCDRPTKQVRYQHNSTDLQTPLANITKNDNKFENQEYWKKIEDITSTEIFVYSAYYDTRMPDKPVVRINAIIHTGAEIQECKLDYVDGTFVRVRAIYSTINEAKYFKYASSFILCDASTRGFSPVRVSLIKNEKTLQPSLKVDDLTKRNHEGFLSVCVKPMHTGYNQAIWLVEFIELNMILGVEKFFIYKHTVGIDVENILKYYSESGVANVLVWNLPVKSKDEITTEGMLSALNDCNLKNIGRYNYTIMIDVDEYIIPRRHNNYQEMLHDLGYHDIYLFQNAFYHLYWENDTIINRDLYKESGIATHHFGSKEVGPYLLTAYKTFRTRDLRPFRARTKYIFDSKKALEVGVHFVWQFTDTNYKNITVKKEIALMNHYRVCEIIGFACISRKRVIDRAAHKWLYSLVERVAETCSNVYTEDKLCPRVLDYGDPKVPIPSRH